MRLATRRSSDPARTRDGELIVVSRDGCRYLEADSVATSLQAALDCWGAAEPQLRELSERLMAEPGGGKPIIPEELLAPLPRAYEWLDGSAFLNHVELVRRARGASLPDSLKTDPLVYQGGSGHLLAPRADLPLQNEDWGMDFEGEVCAVLGDVHVGTASSEASNAVKLLMLANDVSLRNLIRAELSKGFGFLTSKPATAFSPFAVTPDEIGTHWRDGRVHLPLRCLLNGKVLGEINAGTEMHFSFFELIEHIAKTRAFTAGTILGSGTVSSRDPDAGVSCLAERRTRELLETGQPTTPLLRRGDSVQIEMLDESKRNIFGSIIQRVV